MMYQIRFSVAFFFMICAFPWSGLAQTYSSLTVNDPRFGAWWGGETGTVEKATAIMQPKGIFTEVELFLTFSARGTNFAQRAQHDTLEVTFEFDLPAGSLVTDSWLWIGDDIVKAKLIDKWTASQIYENIVQRRRDPSILTKEGNNRYILRIFPMDANETRKVKITYLTPNIWHNDLVQVTVPNEIVESSAHTSNMELLVRSDKTWGVPRLKEQEGLPLTPVNADNNSLFTTQIPYYQVAKTLEFDTPTKNGVFLANYPTATDEGYYELVLQPKKMLNITQGRKILFLLDYEAGNSSINKTQILQAFKTMLQDGLEPIDSFNMALAGASINLYSNKWLPADSITIQQALGTIKENSVAAYSNLYTLLNTGVDFVQTQQGEGTIVLIANASPKGNIESANEYIRDVTARMAVTMPIHILDYQNQNVFYQYVGNTAFTGNTYLYSNLARLTSGGVQNFTDLSGSFLVPAVQQISSPLRDYDLYTTVDNGFCYGRRNLNPADDELPIQQALLQVGKYKGNFPFRVDLIGTYNNEILSSKKVLTNEEITRQDSITKQVWGGLYMLELEGTGTPGYYSETINHSDNTIAKIIDVSTAHRVLSLYTAFLSLEPGQGGEICSNCTDDSVPVQTEEVESAIAKVEVSPNPFYDRTVLTIQWKQKIDLTSSTFTLFDVYGKQVQQLDSDAWKWDTEHQASYELDASGLVSGIYFLVIETPLGKVVVRLVHIA